VEAVKERVLGRVQIARQPNFVERSWEQADLLDSDIATGDRLPTPGGKIRETGYGNSVGETEREKKGSGASDPYCIPPFKGRHIHHLHNLW
jgi:hypothetical protein